MVSGKSRNAVNEPETHTSLINDLGRQPWNEAAWVEFDKQYRSLIVRFARNQGVPEADAKDIAQSVMIGATAALPAFVYDRAQCRFRSWLYTQVNRRVIDWRRRGQSRDRRIEALGRESEIRTDGNGAAKWDQEWERFLVEGALDRLARTRRLDGRSRQILKELYARRRTLQETAELLGRPLQAVRQVNSRWKAILAAAIAEVRQELGE